MNKNKTLKIVLFVVLVFIGLFFFVFGEYDDSPGGQLLGVVVAALGIWGIIKNRK